MIKALIEKTQFLPIFCFQEFPQIMLVDCAQDKSFNFYGFQLKKQSKRSPKLAVR